MTHDSLPLFLAVKIIGFILIQLPRVFILFVNFVYIDHVCIQNVWLLYNVLRAHCDV